MAIYLIALICVIGIAAGQILFKFSATAMNKSGTIFEANTLLILFSAFALYGITTLAWVWVLQKIELGKVYPLMALAFVIVPIGSHLFFGERFQPQYFLGVAVIITGILIAVRA
ncbi:MULTISPECIES: EamA family transporter [Pseudomonas syringae group genomosp. 2]|uniref:Polymyxin resistance protein PmrL, sucrose-6 phosphate hydrolase n=1 Tax=Pseudomonas savastanoi TaxID=29438 RepID=A0A3M5JWQ6_PSESS|nr:MULTISPECIES: EamA family transporter [Pseudomonas syringae group genomosp. 2]KPW56873.1 Polymyxin resistance protein PmrL, sucrose-6 phosphate hydrolase [Pseudomonas syringae pv. broussonetiae]KPX28113.1 Polymyxin resistance protein PmrL, sucrose-6 phosphate hydrolase [Pseudomonas ficuserectae]KWT08535.1 4-amino-4-deoxy-L-arabinose-phospho-UDP flippase [Pseudomonas syringae pv. broussonetiae]RMS21782.1 Polymyxin resistance protein PmrL, sucrose-6 phosphate hydrolase [Pseudomonas savastanoi]